MMLFILSRCYLFFTIGVFCLAFTIAAPDVDAGAILSPSLRMRLQQLNDDIEQMLNEPSNEEGEDLSDVRRDLVIHAISEFGSIAQLMAGIWFKNRFLAGMGSVSLIVPLLPIIRIPYLTYNLILRLPVTRLLIPQFFPFRSLIGNTLDFYFFKNDILDVTYMGEVYDIAGEIVLQEAPKVLQLAKAPLLKHAEAVISDLNKLKDQVLKVITGRSFQSLKDIKEKSIQSLKSNVAVKQCLLRYSQLKGMAAKILEDVNKATVDDNSVDDMRSDGHGGQSATETVVQSTKVKKDSKVLASSNDIQSSSTESEVQPPSNQFPTWAIWVLSAIAITLILMASLYTYSRYGSECCKSSSDNLETITK